MTEKDNSCEHKPKESCGSYTFIRPNRYFKPNMIIGHKDGHCIMIKKSICKKDIIFLNVYAHQIR